MGVFKEQDLLFLDLPGLFLVVSVLIIWLGFCVVIFCIGCLCTVSYVPNVASVSGIVLDDCTFDFH